MPTVSDQRVVTRELAPTRETLTVQRALRRDFQTFSYFCGDLLNFFQWVSLLWKPRTRFMSQWQSHYCYARGNTISHLLNFDPHFTLCHWSVCWQLTVVWFPPFLWDHLGPLSSNTWFQALCHLGSGSVILNLFLARLKHLSNPVTKQSGWKMNLLITVIIYHPNKCHGIGYCYQQYLIVNSILSQSKHNLWWKLLETLPIHGRSSWE